MWICIDLESAQIRLIVSLFETVARIRLRHLRASQPEQNHIKSIILSSMLRFIRALWLFEILRGVKYCYYKKRLLPFLSTLLLTADCYMKCWRTSMAKIKSLWAPLPPHPSYSSLPLTDISLQTTKNSARMRKPCTPRRSILLTIRKITFQTESRSWLNVCWNKCTELKGDYIEHNKKKISLPRRLLFVPPSNWKNRGRIIPTHLSNKGTNLTTFTIMWQLVLEIHYIQYMT